MEEKNKISETLLTQKCNSFSVVENEVQDLKTELRKANSIID
jgi:hypothetical protein